MLGSVSRDLRNKMLSRNIRRLEKAHKLLVVSTFCVWQASSVAAQSENVQIDEPISTHSTESSDTTSTNSKIEKRSGKEPAKSAETFIPTEDISEDIAVAFPVDI